MPYKEGKYWRAVVTHKGRRYQASFKYKRDAVKWENAKRKKIRSLHGGKESITIEDLRRKYEEIYENPHHTMADIFDMGNGRS
jgi:hypothetical protein